jgi:hypothetical protein
MNDTRNPSSINSSTIVVAGVGGLGMLALVVIIAARFAIARWLLFGGLAGGVILAAILILRGSRRRIGAPRSDLPVGVLSADIETGGIKTRETDTDDPRIDRNQQLASEGAS